MTPPKKNRTVTYLRAVYGPRIEKAISRFRRQRAKELLRLIDRQIVRRMAAKSATMAAASLLLMNSAMAQQPTGAEVVGGSAVINVTANVMDINAQSARTIINWDQFSIGAGNTTNFNLPDSSSAVLNRVTSANMPSVINGALNSNGHVHLVNPNGIMVGTSGFVNTNGFTASTFDIANEAFMAGGALSFGNNGADGSVINYGSINTGAGGAHLIANDIANHGSITSIGGNITMSGGGEVTLSNGVTYVQPSLDTLTNGISPTAGLIQNTGTIRATGAVTSSGEVYLANPNGRILHDGTIAAAKSVDADSTVGGHVQLEADQIALADGSLIDASGSHGGGDVLVGGDWQGAGDMVQATTVTMDAGAVIDASATQSGDGGKIVLWSDVLNSDSVTTALGSLRARAGSFFGDGGQIETSGGQVNTAGINVDAGAANGNGGLWLIDPFSYLIDSTAATDIVNALDVGTSVTVTTTSDVAAYGSSGNSGDAGDIVVASDIVTGAMASDATLTLKAHRNVDIQGGVDIDATQNSNTQKLNVVLWADQDESGGGAIRVGDTVTQSTIKTNGGGVALSGGGTTTWTPSTGASDIQIGAGSAVANASVGLARGVQILGTEIDTAGGNFWASGGTTYATSTAAVAYGLDVRESDITTDAGSLSLVGFANPTASRVDLAVGAYIHHDSSLVTTSGDLSVTGTLEATSWYRRGSGVRIGTDYLTHTNTGDALVQTGSGDLSLVGTAAGSVSPEWVVGISLGGYGGASMQVRSGTGDITMTGTATSPGAGAMFGVELATRSTSLIEMGTDGGNIQITGSASNGSTNTDLRLERLDTSGTARIGDANTGSISINADSFLNVHGPGFDMNGVGDLTIQSRNDSFSQAVVTNDTISIGTTFNSITVGKPTNTADVTISSALQAAEEISVYGGDVTLNSSLTTTAAGDGVKLLAHDHLLGTSAASITTAGSDVLLSSDVDGTSGGRIEFSSGLSVNTSGGDITLGGGDATATGYAQGTTGTAEGIRIDGGLTLNSGGGDIAMRGKSLQGTVASNQGAWGVGSFSGVTNINSGAGTILIDGVAPSTTASGTTGYNTGVIFSGTSTTIQSANTTNDAIVIRGDASTAAFGDTRGIAFEASTTSVVATGDGGGILLEGSQGHTDSSAIWFSNDIDILANGGDLRLITPDAGGKMGVDAGTNLRVGSKAGSAVTTSSSDITVQFDRYSFGGSRPAFATSGEFEWMSAAASFGHNVSTSWFRWNADAGQTMSGLAIGKPTNTAEVNMNMGDRQSTANALTVAGAVEVYGGVVNVTNDLTSTDTGDIFLQGNTAANPSVGIGADISKTGGDQSTLTLKGAGRVTVGGGGSVAASNSGGLNVVLWSDFDGGNEGGASIHGSISTNGGSLWAGGSDDASPGSGTWNGLTVGNGESRGAVGYNANGFDLFSSVTTAGGDILLWAGDGVGAGFDGLAMGTSTPRDISLNSGTGDITLIANDIGVGTITVESTGHLTVIPHGNTFTGAGSIYDVTGSTTAGDFTGTGDADWLRINSINSLGGLTLGKTGTTNDITISAAIGVGGDINLFGDDIAINAGLTSIGSNIMRLNASGTVTDGASGFVNTDNLLINAAGATTLDSVSNQIGTLASNGGALTIVESNGLTIGSVDSTDGVTSSGKIDIATLAGNLGLSEDVTTTDTTSTAIVLNAGRSSAAGTATGGSITVDSGTSVSVGSGGSATLYSGDVSDSTGLTDLVGNGSGRFRYNSDEAATNYSLALGAGLNAIYRERPTLGVAVSDATVTYGTAHTPVITVNSQNGDTSAQAFSTAPTASITGTTSSSGHYIAGTHSMTASGAADQLGYAIDYTAGTLTVNQKAISVSGVVANNKVYDGTTAATIDLSGVTFGGIVSGDTVTASGTTGAFADKNVGTSKTVTLSGTTYGGADAGNYSFTNQTSTTADVSQKSITVSGIAANNKVYDGTTAATIDLSGVTFSGLVSGDSVTASGTTGAFADKNVGTSKTVTLSGTTYGGADAGNYSFTSQASTTADVTQKSITVSGIAANNKVYDGTTAATIDLSGVTFTGIVSGDTVTASGTTGAFADKNVATSKTVTLSGTTYGGADAGNYSFTNQTLTTADVTQKSITVSGIAANNKVYDGTTAATIDLSGVTFSGIVSGDTVTASGTTGAFADKNVGTSKTVTFSGTTFGGADVGNYSFTNQASTTADVTQKSITVSGIAANNKVYDRTTAATIDLSGVTFGGIVSGDTVTASGTIGAFSDKNVGTSKTVTLSGTTYGGADAGNYSFTNQTSTTADVTQKSITVSGIAANDKIYDGTTAATIDLSGVTFGGIVSGDTVTASGTTGAFADKNVGTSKTVTLSGTTYGGADAGNYSFTNQTSTTADVTQRSITVSGIAANNKVYDGTTAATIDLSGVTFGGIVSGDTVTASGTTGAFADKNVGTSKTVTLSGTTYGGADAGNYSFTNQTSTTADVTQRSITVSGIAANNKVYDGTTAATIDLSGVTFSGIVSGDTVTASGTTGSFSNKNVGTSKTVTLSGTTYGGADAGNYSFTNQASTTADVTQKSITVSGIAANNKVYDGTTAATIDLSGITFGGLVSGDTVTASGTTGAFADKNVGTSKAVTLSGTTYGGADAGNYSFTHQTSTTADVTQKSITVSGIAANNKVYDGTTAATIDLSGITFTGIVSGDTVTASGTTGVFADKNVGTSKTVTLSGTTYGGADAGNYSFTNQASTTAGISQLDQVTWVGGSTGDWSDPANWAGGAVPDLANVANVIVPDGVTPTFNSLVSGPVQLDSYSGGNLQVDSGILNIVGALVGEALIQKGGTVGAESVDVQKLNQNDGTLNVAGGFAVATCFSQGANGIVNAGGLVQITQAIGDLFVRNVTGNPISVSAVDGGVQLGTVHSSGALTVTAGEGDITQTSGGSVRVGGKTTLQATRSGQPASVILDNMSNDFTGVVCVVGGNVSIDDMDGQFTVQNRVADQEQSRRTISMSVRDTNTRYTDGPLWLHRLKNVVQRYGMPWLQKLAVKLFDEELDPRAVQESDLRFDDDEVFIEPRVTGKIEQTNL